MSAVDRFWAKVSVGAVDECWPWLAARSGGGYGFFQISSRPRRSCVAHRFAYQDAVGEIPQGLTLDHLCRNRVCCNPAHLEPVTNRENVLRGVGITARNASADACIRGHRFDDANTYVDALGKRVCRACSRERQRLYRDRLLSEAEGRASEGRAADPLDARSVQPLSVSLSEPVQLQLVPEQRGAYTGGVHT